MNKKFQVILALALVMALLLPALVAGQDAPEFRVVRTFEPDGAVTPNENGKESAATLDGAIRTEDGRLRVIVELRQPALAAYDGGVARLAPTSVQATGLKLDQMTPAREAYLAYLAARQETLISRLETAAPSATVDYRFTVLLNGMAMAVAEDEIAAIQALPDVVRVYPDRMNTITLDTSLDLINAPEMWAELGGQANAGQGIKVAVVDTGIRPENPFFADTGYTAPPGYPRGYCVANPSFCNDKLIAARYYAPTFPVHALEVLTPLDIDGHGTHTASTAAGNASVIGDPGDGITETLSGVAPRAYVMAYKALFELPDGSTASGSDSMLIPALEDAMLDGADVINNSWGGSAGADPSSSPYQTVIRNIVGSGVVVVFSAGNEGPGAQTIGCPACVEETIAVAASTTNRIHANTVDVTGPGTPPASLTGIAAFQGSGPPIGSDIGPAPISYAGIISPTNATGCTAWGAGTFTGEIALIARGGCTFETKVSNAEDAGAIAAIIYNNVGGPPSAMGGLEGTGIPSVMVDNASGMALVDWITDNPTATARINDEVQRVVNPAWEDILAGFSSRGPNGDPDIFKPDITAPGVNILAGFSPVFGGQNFAFLGGTSMAAPHVAGAAALMVQLHPDWTPQQIKSALTSTADQTLLKENGVTDADPFDMGSGRVDLARALLAGATFEQASFSEGDCFNNCVFASSITNVAGNTTTWTGTVVEPEGVAVTLTPSVVTLTPGEKADFSISVDVSAADADQWYFAWVVWSDGAGPAVDAYLPIAVNNVSTSDPVQVQKEVSHPVIGTGGTVSYTIQIANQSTISRTFEVVDELPAGADYVEGSATGGLTYDEATNTLSWAGDLGPVTVDIVEEDMGGYFSLAGAGVTPFPCPSVTCDDAGWIISGLDFFYLGERYDSVVWTTNGYIYVTSPTSVTPTPQLMPDPAAPNGVIAPLWTDIDLDSGDGNGGGTWYLAGLTDGVNTYTVFEWEDAEQWGDPTSHYTFQLWIQDGTSNIWFTYGDITGDVGPGGAIGVESVDGLLGHTYFYEDPPAPTVGSLPTPGGDDLVVIAEADSRTFTFEAVLTGDDGDRVTNVVQVLIDDIEYHLARADTLIEAVRVFFPILAKSD